MNNERLQFIIIDSKLQYKSENVRRWFKTCCFVKKHGALVLNILNLGVTLKDMCSLVFIRLDVEHPGLHPPFVDHFPRLSIAEAWVPPPAGWPPPWGWPRRHTIINGSFRINVMNE